MEWLQNLFAKITEVIFWQTLISRFQWVDWITIALLILGIVYGSRKGLLREMVEILELFLVIFVTFLCYPTVTSFLSAYIPKMSDRSLAPVAFIVTAAAIWFVVSVLDKQLQTWVHAKLSGVIKTAGGAVLGAVHFMLLWSFLSQAVVLMPVKNLHRFYEAGNSNAGPHVKQLAPELYSRILNAGQAAGQ